jgi:hypothetical protein
MSNLRLVSIEENMQNRTKTANKTTSIYKGVYLDHGKWKAQMKKDGKYYNLGTYATEKEAAEAYNKKAIELNKGFTLLNLIS